MALSQRVAEKKCPKSSVDVEICKRNREGLGCMRYLQLFLGFLSRPIRVRYSEIGKSIAFISAENTIKGLQSTRVHYCRWEDTLRNP
jgi:hypothetical protein